MRTILPRLRNLLGMLAAETKPLPVKEMADRLRVSRRTVFRELANVNAVLETYDLEIGSKSGEGVMLEGPQKARDQLVRDLEKMGGDEPADKRERRRHLVAAILRHPGQKLQTHADRLKVSAPTISHDLDEIEPWLAGRALELGRKSGSGLAVSGDEMRIRRAVLELLAQAAADGAAPPGYPHSDIILDLEDMEAEFDPLLNWMTPESRQALLRYLAVAIQRIMDGCPLPEAAGGDFPHARISGEIARIASEAFNIAMNSGELLALGAELSGCRQVKESRPARSDADRDLYELAGEMVVAFDPDQAHLLTMDEVLVDGLAAHLRTAVVRVRNRMEIADPLLGQIAEKYPDVMAKSRRACEPLRRLGDWLPDDEVSLVAAHFGAAQLRLAEQGLRRRAARLGVVCVYGIGSSYLLASQVKRAFGSRVAVEVSWRDDVENWPHFDFLVSTVELPDAVPPVAVVGPFLSEDDIGRIEALLEKTTARSIRVRPAGGDLIDACRALEEAAAGARGLLEDVAVAPVNAGAGVGELAALAGILFEKRLGDAALIEKALVEREKVATQVIPELSLILLHCRTAGVARPGFAALIPKGGELARDGMGKARACVVMLLPEKARRETAEMMGYISSALIEREGFLACVHTGDAGCIRDAVEDLLGEYLQHLARQKLKG